MKHNLLLRKTLIRNDLNALVYDSEQFTLLGPSKNTENFLTYEEEYGVYDESKQNQDEDVIDMESAD